MMEDCEEFLKQQEPSQSRILNRPPSKKWIVLMSSFVCFLSTGIGYSFGVLHVALLKQYKRSFTETSWLGSLFSCSLCIFAPLGSVIINKWGSQRCIEIGCARNLLGFAASGLLPYFELLFLTYGIVAGCGQSLVYTGTLVNVAYYFDHQRTFATGVGLMGVGIGIIIFPTLTQYLLEQFSLDGTLLMLGAIAFQVLVFVELVRTHPKEIEVHIQRNKSKVRTKLIQKKQSFKLLKWTHTFKDLPFCFLCLSIIAWSAAVNACLLFLPDYFLVKGSSSSEAAILMSIYGMGNMISRLLTGVATIQGGLDCELLYSFCYGILTFITIGFPWYSDILAGKIAFCFLTGLYSGGSFVLLPQLAIEVKGMEGFVAAMGIEIFAVGIGYFLGPIIIGYVIQVKGFMLAFCFVGFLYFWAFFLAMGFAVMVSKKAKNQSQKLEDVLLEKTVKDIQDI